jgi:hypothetical protein
LDQCQRRGIRLARLRKVRTEALARIGGIGANLALRVVIVGVVADARRHPDARRYAGKGIGTRGLVLVAASCAVPVLYLLGMRRPYPVWTDTLHLSIYALDMAGNYFDLYDTYRHFDLIPHAHGTGAATVVVGEMLPVDVVGAAGLAQAAHLLLEAQEYVSDVLFGLRNVRGWWDTAGDLLAGLAGSTLYGVAYALFRRGRR